MKIGYANWSLNRKSRWHRATCTGVNAVDLPLCADPRIKGSAQWWHSEKPDNARICETCERLAKAAS